MSDQTSELPISLRRMVRRINSWLNRRQKRKPKVWLVRVRCALDNFWLRFYRMPRTEHTLQWAERNHARIINVKPPWCAPYQTAFIDRCNRDPEFKRRMEHAVSEGRRIIASWYPPNGKGQR